MYRILIIEDEKPAADWLRQLILKFNPEISILAICDSVGSAVEWFRHNLAPDLVFMDIQLADGLSFEIFERTKVGCPVIFTTAYEEYAIKAFKVNSVDCLLKPISYDELVNAFQKFGNQFKNAPDSPSVTIELLSKVKEMLRKQYKTRFVIKVGEHLKSIPIEEIPSETPMLNPGNDSELMELIHELPAGCRTVFNMYAIEGYSHDEIASTLNIKASTSRSQFMKARKMLLIKLNR